MLAAAETPPQFLVVPLFMPGREFAGAARAALRRAGIKPPPSRTPEAECDDGEDDWTGFVFLYLNRLHKWRLKGPLHGHRGAPAGDGSYGALVKEFLLTEEERAARTSAPKRTPKEKDRLEALEDKAKKKVKRAQSFIRAMDGGTAFVDRVVDRIEECARAAINGGRVAFVIGIDEASPVRAPGFIVDLPDDVWPNSGPLHDFTDTVIRQLLETTNQAKNDTWTRVAEECFERAWLAAEQEQRGAPAEFGRRWRSAEEKVTAAIDKRPVETYPEALDGVSQDDAAEFFALSLIERKVVRTFFLEWRDSLLDLPEGGTF